MRKMLRYRMLCYLSSLLLSAIALNLNGAVPTSAQQTREITIGLPSKSIVAAPPRIMQEMGLYERHGLKPRMVFLDSANGATGALISKSVDISISGLTEVVAAQSRGQKVVVFANSYVGLSGSLVLAKSVADKLAISTNAPVAERLKALDGLLIASTSPTSAFTIAYKGAASAQGSNARFTFMALPAMGAAMDSGAIQGFIATAPFWTFPVIKGTGVLWISAPKGEVPAEHSTASGANYQVMREFAEGNPDVIKKFNAVLADFAKAIDERPNDVKAAIIKLYPELDQPALDLLFSLETRAWKNKPLTAGDITREIAFVKSSGAQLPDADKIDPASMLLAP